MNDADATCRDALRTLRSDWPPGTDLLVIEVHDLGERGLRDLIAYPMTRSGDQVQGDYQVVGRDCQVPEAAETIDNVRVAVEFVASRWAEIGIATDLPVYVAGHDNWESFDVRNGCWVSDGELYDS